jgi:hypothetical protein
MILFCFGNHLADLVALALKLVNNKLPSDYVLIRIYKWKVLFEWMCFSGVPKSVGSMGKFDLWPTLPMVLVVLLIVLYYRRRQQAKTDMPVHYRWILYPHKVWNECRWYNVPAIFTYRNNMVYFNYPRDQPWQPSVHSHRITNPNTEQRRYWEPTQQILALASKNHKSNWSKYLRWWR